MNVLVYSGPGVIQSSLTNVIASLRNILIPNYTVQPLTHQALTSHPWASNCALLVFPACDQIQPSTSIKSYLEDGGPLLAFSVSVRGSRENLISSLSGLTMGQEQLLRVTDRTSGNSITVELQGSNSTVLTDVEFDGGRVPEVQCNSPQPSFPDVIGKINFKALGKFPDGVVAGISHGKSVLWAPRLEQALSGEPETQRQLLLRKSLRICGLNISDDSPARNTPLPQFLVGKPEVITHILKELSVENSSQDPVIFKDDNDTLKLHPSAAAASVLEEIRDTDPAKWQPKHILVYPDGTFPAKEQTSMFDLELYFEELSKARKDLKTRDKWGIGEALLYGEAVTSTQTMLDKNPRFLSLLPTPFLSLASQQLQGRGRGTNVWLSPAGCLQFSLLLRVPLSIVPANKIVFVQYLFSLAVTEACRDPAVLGKWGDSVRLKWPNDLYAIVGKEKKKIGGILVNTSFSGGQVDIIIGCGVNVLNPPPITSLSQLVPEDVNLDLRMERTAANIMAKFETMWNKFVDSRGSFDDDFMDLYLRRWLHSNEIVTLTTTKPEKKVRIIGITSDHGLLRTMPEPARSDEGFIDLMPDGNSFDIMARLIKSKS